MTAGQATWAVQGDSPHVAGDGKNGAVYGKRNAT
jgi:hypothetical protein